MYLSGKARHVHVLVRGASLSETMSDYLVQRLLGSASVTIHTHCEITSLDGEFGLEGVTWRTREGRMVRKCADNLFLMIGAVPNTDWLSGCVDLDQAGFVRTGVVHKSMVDCGQYVTSMPGIFAVGDARSQSVKRVASSVGEGSVVVHAIHRWLASLRDG
jgi:thioredoxin reductase (NADPH)